MPSGASAADGPDIEAHDGYCLTAVAHVVVGAGDGDELHAGTQGTALAHIAAVAGGDECYVGTQGRHLTAVLAAHIAVGTGAPVATPALNTLDSEAYSKGVQTTAPFLRRPSNRCTAQLHRKLASVPENQRTSHKRSLSEGLSQCFSLQR